MKVASTDKEMVGEPVDNEHATSSMQPSLSVDTTPPAYPFVEPVQLTPIPEESLRPSNSQIFFPVTASWDSGDLSPTSSLESRSAIARQRLRQLLQRLRPSSDESSVEGLGGAGEDSMPTSAWLVAALNSADPERIQPGSSSESGQDPNYSSGGGGDGPYSLIDSSTRSSLADFLRLENLCETGRSEMSEEEARLTADQFDASLRDLVASIQALHNQHLEGSAETGGAESVSLSNGSGPVASSESSLVSQLASGSMERRIGAGLAEMTAGEVTGRFASIVAAQMQQLIHSVSTDQRGSGSHVSSSPSADSSNGPFSGGGVRRNIRSGGSSACGVEESNENGVASSTKSSS